MNVQKFPEYAAYAIMAFGIAYAAYSEFGGGGGGKVVSALGLIFVILFVGIVMLKAISMVDVDKWAPKKPH